MKKILVAYTSHSGSTKEAAEFIGKEISAAGCQVDILPVSAISDITSYDQVIAGGLVYRFGWHPEISKFLRDNSHILKDRKTAIFVVGLRLVKTKNLEDAGFPVFVDPNILYIPKNEEKLNALDSFSTMNGYMKQSIATLKEIHPISLGFFCGKLDLKVLSFPEQIIMRFLMLFTGIKEGDHRNWEAIRKWADSL
jgi:menaquinone-dependent protoporphyrinogen IX oxidase